MENILLVEKCRNGDRDAFARLVEKYQGMVSAITLNIVGDYAQSEDLAQETFLTAWKNLPELREPEKLASWFYGIARRVALRWQERQQKNPLQGAAELDADALPDDQTDAEERLQRERSLALVWSMVKEMPEKFREPLLLYYRYSRSTADIAELMQLTEENVRQRLARGRKMLKAKVKKQVESVLESTRPSKHFVVAVLAAIPVLATSSEIFAATSAAGSASVAAKSSGSVPFLASLGAYLGTLANAVFFPLALFVGVLSGAWNGVRNSPTLRSRRFMLKAAVFQAMMGLSLFVFFGVFARSCNQFCPLSGQSPMQTFITCFFTGAIVFIGLYCVLSSYAINRRWRKIVEEDTERPIETAELEQSPLSLRRLRTFLYYSMIGPFVAVLPTVLFTMFMLEQHGRHWWTYFNSISLAHIYSEVLIFPPLGVMVTVAIFYFVVEKRVVDEQSLVTWRPMVPNLLQVLTGEAKPRTGLRYRTNFWSDLLLLGIGFCMIQGGLCANYFAPPSSTLAAADVTVLQCCYQGVFALSLLIYILFAVFYAGIPRRRYVGYIYFGLFLFLFSIVFVLLLEPWLYGRLGAEPRWHSDRIVLTLILFWLSCFVMVGIAGINAFRKHL